jgi:large subunit ribosomal protein L10
MKREEKQEIISELQELIQNNSHFYLADIGELNAETTSQIRRKCFENDIKLVVVKNTLFRIALENSEKNYGDIYTALKGSTSVMFTDNSKAPAKLIKEFRKKHKKPLLKAAYVQESVFIGDNQLDALVNIKSKEELIGDVILLLQSPMKTVVSQLQSGKNILAGIVKTLSDKQ